MSRVLPKSVLLSLALTKYPPLSDTQFFSQFLTLLSLLSSHLPPSIREIVPETKQWIHLLWDDPIPLDQPNICQFECCLIFYSHFSHPQSVDSIIICRRRFVKRYRYAVHRSEYENRSAVEINMVGRRWHVTGPAVRITSRGPYYLHSSTGVALSTDYWCMLMPNDTLLTPSAGYCWRRVGSLTRLSY